MTAEHPLGDPGARQKDPEVNRYFRAAIKTLASDIHLKVGQPPKLRLYGSLKNTTGEPMTRERVEELIFEILSPAQKEFFRDHGTLDFAHEVDGNNRFRINIFRQRGMVSLAARRVNTTIPPFEELHLPPILEKISESTQGLILVVGPTGSGKTTTIASMVDHINRTRSCHIVTVEDPIEYLFHDEKAIVSQREIGLDVVDFDEALTYLMRQDPDVVFVGEMRDAKTVVAGMRAAETGHLVFGTMHSANASQSVHRLLDLFPQSERDLVRQTLALALKAVISQFLIPCLKEGIDRVPAVEVLICNAAARKLIAEEREADLPSVIRASVQEGMQDITLNLCGMIKNGMIDPKEAFLVLAAIEYGGYISVVKLVIFTVFFFVWIPLVSWVHNDAKAVDTNDVFWTGLVLGSGAAGLMLWQLIPIFIVGLLIYVVAVSATSLAYVKHRNARVMDFDRVLTAEHLTAEHLKNLFVSNESKLEALESFTFITSNRNEVPLPEPRTPLFFGYKMSYDLLTDAAWRRAANVIFSPTPHEYRVTYFVDGTSIQQPSIPREQAKFIM